LSGTDIVGQGTNTLGNSITHTLDLINVTGTGEFYYYRNTADGATAEPIHNYSSEPPVLQDGSIWTDTNTGLTDVGGEWHQIEMLLNYNELDQSQINGKMKAFMDTNKDMCDKISSCGGFTVTRFNRLTSEIDAIEKAGIRDTGNGSVDPAVLSTLLQGDPNATPPVPPLKILEYGTMKGVQKGNECNSHRNPTIVGFHDEWGSTTDNGGNSYVYTQLGLEDVLNADVVPSNSDIYFEKKMLAGNTGDPLMGYTNNDQP